MPFASLLQNTIMSIGRVSLLLSLSNNNNNNNNVTVTGSTFDEMSDELDI